MGVQKSKLCKIQPVYTPDPCVICLQPSLKHTGCNRCKECRICRSCYNNLKKTNNTKKCPVCNLECEKCKRGESHKICTWTTRKSTMFETVIDIKSGPVTEPAPITINRETTETREQKCIKCPSISYLDIKCTLKILSHTCSFLLLCFFIGLIAVSSVNTGMPHDLTIGFGFTCMGVGFIVILFILCMCNAPCCCDYNIITCVKELYCSDD